MEIHIVSMILLAGSLILMGACTIMIWSKLRRMGANNNPIAPTHNKHPELDTLESRMNDKIDYLERLINSQSTLISVISTSLGVGRTNNFVPGKEDEEKISIEKEHTEDENKPTIPNVISRIRPEDAEKKLESLLNGADFTGSIWQQFSRPFDVCAEKLISYLGENGLPTPRLEPYPALKDNNPNFWTFMVVQAQNWSTEGKRFLIPRNYDRYDVLWHQHLFDVRGNTNKADNYINGLVRCAMLKTGMLTGNIDKQIVDMKGIIAVE